MASIVVVLLLQVSNWAETAKEFGMMFVWLLLTYNKLEQEANEKKKNKSKNNQNSKPLNNQTITHSPSLPISSCMSSQLRPLLYRGQETAFGPRLSLVI